MADNITFMTIPTNWRVPGAKLEIDHNKAVRGLVQMQHSILILAQRLSTGSVAAGERVLVSRKEDGINYGGRGSMAAQMVESALRVNPYTPCYLLMLDDNPAGQEASGAIAFAGTPTESGTLYLYIGGRRITVGITASQTAGQIATNVANVINADLDGAVTASTATGTVTIISRHKGVEGNDIDIRTNYYQGEYIPKGITVTITPMSGGTANPDVAEAIAAMSTLSPYTILCGWTDAANVAALEIEFQLRWGGMQMRAAHLFGHKNGSYSTLSAYGSGRNSAHSTFSGLNKSPTLPWVIAAQFGAAIEFSGANDPAIPFRSIELPDVMAPHESGRFLESERNNLLYDGISTIVFDQSGKASIEQVITTYQQNSFGIEDASLLKLNTKWTVDFMRFTYRNDVLTDFPRHKLAGDEVLGQIAPGQPVATPKLIKNTLIASHRKLIRAGIAEGTMEDFIRDTQVLRSMADTCRVNSIITPNTVNQFDMFAGAIQYTL